MHRFFELVNIGNRIIQEASPTALNKSNKDAPMFYTKGVRGARAGLFTNKVHRAGMISGGLLSGVGATAGALHGGSLKARVAKGAIGAAIGGGLGYAGGRANQGQLNRMTQDSFTRAGWKPAARKQYKKSEVKNRFVFPKDVIKKNFAM